MKKVKIISVVEIDYFIEYLRTVVLDSNKTTVLKAMNIAPVYDAAKRRSKTHFSAYISKRIIDYAKEMGYSFGE